MSAPAFALWVRSTPKKNEKKMIKRLCTEKGLLVGGNANNSSNAGFVYSNSNNDPSNTNTNIGSHLCFYMILFSTSLANMAKKYIFNLERWYREGKRSIESKEK